MPCLEDQEEDYAEPGNPGKTLKSYGIWIYPTYILIDRTGNVVPRGGVQFHDVPTADEIKKTPRSVRAMPGSDAFDSVPTFFSPCGIRVEKRAEKAAAKPRNCCAITAV